MAVNNTATRSYRLSRRSMSYWCHEDEEDDEKDNGLFETSFHLLKKQDLMKIIKSQMKKITRAENTIKTYEIMIKKMNEEFDKQDRLPDNMTLDREIFRNRHTIMNTEKLLTRRIELLGDLVENGINRTESIRTFLENLGEAPANVDINKKKNDNELTCGICYETKLTKLKLKCNHKFCDECIGNWTGRYNNKTCPLCRAVINTDDLEYEKDCKPIKNTALSFLLMNH